MIGSSVSVTLERVVLKAGETPSWVKLSNNVKVAAVRVCQVARIEVRHCSKHIFPPMFSVEKPTDFKCVASLSVPGSSEKEKANMKMTQFPILSSTATTGHKLQGTTVDNLYVHHWPFAKQCRKKKDASKLNKLKKWPYVVLSRVRTMKGLFMRKKLSYNLDHYTLHPNLEKMMKGFESRAVEPLSDEEINDILFGPTHRLRGG